MRLYLHDESLLKSVLSHIQHRSVDNANNLSHLANHGGKLS